jgi:hypothetical protein
MGAVFMFRNFAAFVKSFSHTWVSAMSGSPTVPFAILALYLTDTYAKSLFGAMALICGVLSSYLVWNEQYIKVCKHENQASANEMTVQLGRVIANLVNEYDSLIDTSVYSEDAVLKLLADTDKLESVFEALLARIPEQVSLRTFGNLPEMKTGPMPNSFNWRHEELRRFLFLRRDTLMCLIRELSVTASYPQPTP